MVHVRNRSVLRHGSAAVEAAVVMPLLIVLGLGATDLGLFSYANIQLASAAANGALYASKSLAAASDTDGIKNAAFIDRLDMPDSWWNKFSSDFNYNTSGNPAVNSQLFDEGSGRKSVEVTLTYNYSTRLTYPGIPSSLTIVQKVRMPITL